VKSKNGTSVCTGSEADAHLEKVNELFYYRSVCTGSEARVR